MDKNLDIRRMCCYAAIKAGYSGKNYLEAHMRLVLALIYQNGYKSIDPHVLVEDFKKGNQYEIGYFPMLNILGLAVNEGYLSRKHNSKQYTSTQRINEFSGVHSDIIKEETKYRVLVNHFISYCLEKGKEITSSLAQEVVNSYVENQKLSHISGHISLEQKDNSLEYLFNCFIYELKNQGDPSFDFLCNMVTGSILSDCLIYNEEIQNSNHLEGLTLILDTAVAFICLDVDNADRGFYYREMFDELTKKGAKLAVFHHTYDEMQRILLGAAEWIESTEYNPALASETLEYFHNKNKSRVAIERFADELRANLESLKIEVIDVPHVEKNFIYHADENKLHSMIQDRYEQTNPYFDSELQWNTIRNDAQSISYTYVLRNGLKPSRISDATYIFVTKNNSISQVAYDYHSEVFHHDKTLPTVLTDVFLGTYTWLENPVKINQLNSRQIFAQAYLAFQPNQVLMNKLSKALDEMQEEGEITPEVCYSLKSNKLVSEKLARKTFGDPDAFTVYTAHEIYQEILLEQREAGRTEEREIAQKQIAEIIEKGQSETSAVIEQKKKTERQLQNSLQKNLDNAKASLKALESKEKKAQGTKKRWKCLFMGVAVVLLVMIAASVITYIYSRNADWYSPIIALLCTIIPLVIALLAFIISLATGKTINVITMINRFIDKRYYSRCVKLGCTPEERQRLEAEIKQLSDQLNSLTVE